VAPKPRPSLLADPASWLVWFIRSFIHSFNLFVEYLLCLQQDSQGQVRVIAINQTDVTSAPAEVSPGCVHVCVTIQRATALDCKGPCDTGHCLHSGDYGSAWKRH
jgi:hypothetical protein